MNSTVDGNDAAADEYLTVTAEALQYLPAEWRNKLQKTMDDGRALLVSVDDELSHLIRLTNSFPAIVVLKHIKTRLAGYEFVPTLEAILELDMLTTAFVVTYVRLARGGNGTGFQRDALPAALREHHDQIVELRNKRSLTALTTIRLAVRLRSRLRRASSIQRLRSVWGITLAAQMSGTRS